MKADAFLHYRGQITASIDLDEVLRVYAEAYGSKPPHRLTGFDLRQLSAIARHRIRAIVADEQKHITTWERERDEGID